jgi:uncharacterized protein (TIGR03905 family)
MYEYHTKGTCSRKICFNVEGSRLSNVLFDGGCDGNAKALTKLLEGMQAREAMEKLAGIRCGNKGTSCADQLARAIAETLEKIGI